MTVIEKTVYLLISNIYIIIYILLTLFSSPIQKIVICHNCHLSFHFLHFFTAKGILFGNYFVFLHRLCPRFGWRGQWHDILEKRHRALCFLVTWTTTIKSQSKTNAEVTPTGVYIRSRSVPRANHALTGTLLGVFCIYSSVGIYSVRSIEMAVVGQSYGTSRCGYPVFHLCGSDDRITNHSGTWVSAGVKWGAECHQLRYRVLNHKWQKLLNYFINRATNASAESLNSKIKGFRAQLHGIADIPFFMYRICTIFG